MRAAHSAALTWSRIELPLVTRLTAMTRTPREYVARHAFYATSVRFVTGFTSMPTAGRSPVDEWAMSAPGPGCVKTPSMIGFSCDLAGGFDGALCRWR